MNERYLEEWTMIQAKFKTETPLGLDQKDEPKRAIFEAMIYWLAKIYMETRWQKITRSKGIYRENVFEHTVKAGASQKNIRRVNDKICENLGLQRISISSQIFDFLEQHKREALQALRLEPIYFCLKATELAGDLWEFYKTQEEETEKEDEENDVNSENI